MRSSLLSRAFGRIRVGPTARFHMGQFAAAFPHPDDPLFAAMKRDSTGNESLSDDVACASVEAAHAYSEGCDGADGILAELIGDEPLSAFMRQVWDRTARLYPGCAPDDIVCAGRAAIALEAVAAGRVQAEACEFYVGTDKVKAPKDRPLAEWLRAERPSMTVHGIDIDVPALRRLNDVGGAYPEAAPYITAFLAQPRRRLLPLHWDPDNTFIIQVQGARRWRVYPTGRHHPTQWDRTPGFPETLEALGDPCLETTLQPGDVLFIPRGFTHTVSTLDECASHLALILRHPCDWDWECFLMMRLMAARREVPSARRLAVESAFSAADAMRTLADESERMVERQGDERLRSEFRAEFAVAGHSGYRRPTPKAPPLPERLSLPPEPIFWFDRSNAVEILFRRARWRFDSGCLPAIKWVFETARFDAAHFVANCPVAAWDEHAALGCLTELYEHGMLVAC